MPRLYLYRLLIALAAVMTLVAPIRPAIASAAPLDTAIAAVEPAVVQIDTTIDYQHAIGAGTGFVLNPSGEVSRTSTSFRAPTSSPRTASAPARASRSTWSATTGDTTSQCCSCAAPGACPPHHWVIRHCRRRGARRRDGQCEPGQPADPRSGHHHTARPDDRRQGRVDGQLRPVDRPDRGRAPTSGQATPAGRW